MSADSPSPAEPTAQTAPESDSTVPDADALVADIEQALQDAQEATDQTAAQLDNQQASPADQGQTLPALTQAKLERMLSMKFPVIVKVAERPMPISAVLNLNLGSVVTFDKDAYQHIELMVNNETIGVGQAVKIGEKFGLRIVQIGEATDTIKTLGITDPNDPPEN